MCFGSGCERRNSRGLGGNTLVLFSSVDGLPETRRVSGKCNEIPRASWCTTKVFLPAFQPEMLVQLEGPALKIELIAD